MTDQTVPSMGSTSMTGTKSARNRNVKFEPIINHNMGNSFEFLMAIHKHSLVKLTIDGQQDFYYVEKLGQVSDGKQSRLTLMPHIVAVGNTGKVSDSIQNLVNKYKMALCKINAIGKLLDD